MHIQVFVSPTCPYCPAAVRMAHRLALASARVTADMVMVAEFPHLVQSTPSWPCPRTVVNETLSFEGALSEEKSSQKVVDAASGAEAPSITLRDD